MAESEDVLGGMRERLRHISLQDFATLGAKDIVYLQPMEMGEDDGVGIFGADGTLLKVVPNMGVAEMVIEDNDLRLVPTH